MSTNPQAADQLTSETLANVPQDEFNAGPPSTISRRERREAARDAGASTREQRRSAGFTRRDEGDVEGQHERTSSGSTGELQALGDVAEDRRSTPGASDPPGNQSRTSRGPGRVVQTPSRTQGTERAPPAPRAQEANYAPRQDPAISANLNDVQRTLLAELVEINGQDSYDSLTAGIGKLKRDEYLRLPNGLRLPRVDPRDVGKPIAHSGLNANDWANIYVLNKGIAPEGSDATIFGFLRMEAMKAGWFDDQREITFMTPIAGSLGIMLTDFATVKDRVADIKTAAFIIPLVAEHVFRTMGHHYITSDAVTYTARYTDTFRSCLLPNIAGMLPPAVLYHSALHWVSPRRSRAVLVAQAGTPSLPDALFIRLNAAPAGTAILTTTAAIIDAMESVKMASAFAEHGGFDIDLMRNVTTTIKSDPCRYHKSYFAYGVNALDAGENANLLAAKNAAIGFAPYAQAFINTLLRDAALGRARALLKHAEANPIQLRRAQAYFRALTRKEVTSVAQLFDSTVSTRDLA